MGNQSNWPNQVMWMLLASDEGDYWSMTKMKMWTLMTMFQTESPARVQSSNWFWYAGGAKVEACLRGISHHCRPVFSDAFAVLMRVSMFLLISSILKANCWQSSKTKSFYNCTQTSQQTPSSPKTSSTENKFIHGWIFWKYIQSNKTFDFIICLLIEKTILCVY